MRNTSPSVQYVCLCLTSWFHQCQSLEVARQQDVMQVSVAAVECDVPDVPHHDVLHTNIILPEKRKGETNVRRRKMTGIYQLLTEIMNRGKLRWKGDQKMDPLKNQIPFPWIVWTCWTIENVHWHFFMPLKWLNYNFSFMKMLVRTDP